VTTRITVDPITHIEGHLRIDVEVDDGKVSKAWSSGQMWRGIEKILVGRDPREAWTYTQRFCGVCTTVHAITSVRAVENALDLEIPVNAQLIRNIIQTAHAIQDHIVHFYHLSAVDWVDVVSALDADPVATAKLAESLSDWPLNGPHEMKAVQERLKTFVGSGQLGPFASGYWGHPAMKLPPEVNLLAVAHYLQALDVQNNANKIVAILGGKSPHIQNVAVGGVSNSINHDAPSVLNIERLMLIKGFIDKLEQFIKSTDLVDVPAVGAFYLDWAGVGGGVNNYLTVPDCPQDPKGEIKGVGFHQAPRGTLSHWVVIEDAKIKNYQAVVPSTWNAGPRDANDEIGPYESSLMDNPVADPEKPLEVLRTVHSFDPCIACAQSQRRQWSLAA
jgi:hydrogenase large subunit